MDDLAFIHSMVAKSNNHTPAAFQMNTGFTMNGFPCMGAWLSYGLGTVNEDLPAFVVLPDPRGLARRRIDQLDGRVSACQLPRRGVSHERPGSHRGPEHAAQASVRKPGAAGLKLLAT